MMLSPLFSPVTLSTRFIYQHAYQGNMEISVTDIEMQIGGHVLLKLYQNQSGWHTKSNRSKNGNLLAPHYKLYICLLQHVKFRRKRVAEWTDERVSVMKEIVSGMRIIKMYTWEKPFAEVVDSIRRQEEQKTPLQHQPR